MTCLEQSQQKEILQLQEENKLLRQKLDLLIRQMFGKKSEKLDPAQLELLFSEMDDNALGKDESSTAHIELLEDEPKSRRRKPSEPRRPRIPEHLPVVEEIIDPDPVKACPDAWRLIGEEVSEQLDYEPATFLRRRLVRRKYVKKANREAPPIIADLPPKLVDGGIASPGLLSQIVIAKYCDHLPLYRQEQIFSQRHGVEIPRQTMARWVEVVADWLRPIYDEMTRKMFTGSYVGADETPIKYLEPGAGKTKQGYLWAYRVPDGDTIFDWHPGRGHECLESFIPESYNGIIQCDGFIAYKTYVSDRKGIKLAGCWAHARRKFHDAFEVGEFRELSGWILRQIQHLYRIEQKLRDCRAAPSLRKVVRSHESKPILKRIKKALLLFESRSSILPKSLFGKAISYTLNQWELLEVYAGNGLVEIDNNLTENAIRPTAIGKKNWLFIGSKEAGWRSAIIYSIIESCRNRGINPAEYMRDVLTRLPSMTNWQISEITPQAWAKAKEEAKKLSDAA